MVSDCKICTNFQYFLINMGQGEVSQKYEFNFRISVSFTFSFDFEFKNFFPIILDDIFISFSTSTAMS